MRSAIAAAVLIACGAFALAGCQTMSAEECAAADWRSIGYADGESGNPHFASRQESCGKKGFAADAGAYQSGFSEGVRLYCVPPRGFQRGMSGQDYAGFCPADQEELFAAAHADGRRVHEARAALEAAEGEQRRLENRRDELDRRIHDQENALSAATADEDRERIRNDVRRLNDERRRVNDDIRTQIGQVRFRTGAIERLRYEIADRWGPW